MTEMCYWVFCFVAPAVTENPKIFGFSEFITALALLIVLYTIVDIRYKFRLSITPGALYPVTFAVITVIALATLVSDIWIAQHWWIPKVIGLSAPILQGTFGALFIASFLTWTYYAFIRPPIFCKRNAKQFAQSLYRVILKGNDAELSVVANELARSAMPLVQLSRRISTRRDPVPQANQGKTVDPTPANFAHEILLLIANRKFCRHIAESSPVTAIAFFQCMTQERIYNIPIGHFARTVSAEAINNKQSILHEEGDGFTSGLIGYLKPWSQTLYGNYELVESLANNFGSPLDIDYRAKRAWDADNWEAYCRAIICAFKGYVTSNRRNQHSYAMYRAFQELKDSLMDVYKLNEEVSDMYVSDIFARLHVIVGFVRDAIDLLSEQQDPPDFILRRREEDSDKDVYDWLANLMFEILFAASAVSAPPDKCWSIHHNATWGMFFGLDHKGAWRVVQHKLRRLLYREVVRMDEFFNYKGARILGLLLNVMGLRAQKGPGSIDKEYRALGRVVRKWAANNFLRMRQDLPDVADAVLIGGITFDEKNRRLVKTYLGGLRKEPSREYLELVPPIGPTDN